MRENIANSSPMETFSLNGVQTPYNNISNDPKSAFMSVSSNVYYGYQPLRVANNNSEPMYAEPLNKSFIEMDTAPCESRLVNRKRTRDTAESILSSLPTWKKRRQNEPLRPVHQSPRCSPSKMLLEDLLRETHGCSYYHWVSSNI